MSTSPRTKKRDVDLPTAEPRVPIVVSSTLFHGRVPGGALALGPTCVLMVRASVVPEWVGEHHDRGLLHVDYPDEHGRIAALNALIDAGDATLVVGRYLHASSRALAHLRCMVPDSASCADLS